MIIEAKPLKTMENEEDEIIDSPNDTEGTENANEEEGADPESEETEGDSKPKYTENEKKLYARAKKAENEAKLAKEELAKSKTSGKPAPVGDVSKIISAELDKRDLDALDLSDELKKEVSTFAKVQNVTIKQALKSDYISFLKEKEEKKEKIDNASLGGNRRGNTKKDYSEMKASDFNLGTPEGKADFAKYEEHLKKQLG
jgi:hypothetical protein